jgi:hypothetical protein
MIKNYFEYIKENKIIGPVSKIKNVLDKILNDLNLDSSKNCSYKIEEYSNNNVYTIFICSNILNNIIGIEFSNSNSSYVIFRTSNNYDCVYISYCNDEKKLYNTIKEIIIKAFIIEYFEYFSDNNTYSYNHDINLKSSIDDIIMKYLKLEDSQIIKDAFTVLPSSIAKKYEYLLKANNFDLI